MGRGGNTGVRSSQQAQQASTRLRILRCSGPLPEQSKLLAGAQELNKQVCGNCYNYEYDGFVFVDELGESAITVGLRAWVATENYWPVKWKMNERIKEEFDAAGISIPYNQLDVHICPEPANKKAGKGDK